MSNFSRSSSRKFLYQYLYARTFWEVDLIEFKESFFSWVYDSNLDEDYFNEMIDIIILNQVWILKIISNYAPKFKIKDMEQSYLLPLFVWISEMIFLEEEIPAKVIINESVQLAKIYWDESAWKMVNWVLHTITTSLATIKYDIIKSNNSDISIIFK